MQSSDTENCNLSSLSTHHLFFSLFCILFDTSSQRVDPIMNQHFSCTWFSFSVSFSVLLPPLWLPGHPDVFHLVLVNLASRLCVFSLSLCCMCMCPCCAFVLAGSPELSSSWSHWDTVSCWRLTDSSFLYYLSPVSLSSWYKPGIVTCFVSCISPWVKKIKDFLANTLIAHLLPTMTF